MPQTVNLVPDPKGVLNTGVEYPLRKPGDVGRFFLIMFALPVLLTATLNLLCAVFLFPNTEIALLINLALLNAGVLFLFQVLLWTPNFLAIFSGSERVENAIMHGRNISMIGITLCMFPHGLVINFLTERSPILNLVNLYIGLIAVFCLIYFYLLIKNLKRAASRDVRAGASPQERKYSERWIGFDSFSLFLILFGVVVIQLWFLDAAGPGTFPYESTMSLATVEETRLLHELEAITWFCCSMLSALLFFLWPCLGHRLMSSVLISVTFHERDVKGILFRSQRYLRHFAVAMLLRNPILLPGGLALSIVFFATPIFFIAAKQYQLLDRIVQADQVVLALGVFFAWFSPLTKSAVQPESTFGEYFNKRVENLILSINGHVLIVGLGSLGKRILRRETRQLLRGERDKNFMEVVTPDVRLEYLCNRIIAVERDPGDVVYSAGSPLLGQFGVVSTCEENYISKDPAGELIHPEKRVLIPVVLGEAGNPVVSSRVNFERAKLIISTVPDETSVQEVFDRASRANVKAIICVSRSDQISYLTYRARHRQIVLVYPKHSQGNTLGYRLWAAMQKAKAVKKRQDWPKVLIVGNNKSTHYMLETIYAYLPGDHSSRSAIIEKNFAFIVLDTGASAYPTLQEQKSGAFTHVWAEGFVTGGRFSAKLDRSRTIISPQLKVRIVNDGDNAALESCILDHRPEILVINHGDNAASMILSRCIRGLERLKALQNLPLPLLLLATTEGDKHEKFRLGDYSRYYDSLAGLYGEDIAVSPFYPKHAKYSYFTGELKGGTIIDSMADTEEIVGSARRSLLRQEEVGASKKNRRFMEVNSCLPNSPGELAAYLAKLARLKFSPVDYQRWQSSSNRLMLPSFQYLRNIIDDGDNSSFYLTGYATLGELSATTETDMEALGTSRLYVNDGRNYVDTKSALRREVSSPLGRHIQQHLTAIEDPPGIGVEQVLDRLAGREAGRGNTLAEFKQMLFDKSGKTAPDDNGRLSCPGMNLCRIASYQDYIIANNDKLIGSGEAPLPAEESIELDHSRNYFCCTSRPSIKAAPVAGEPLARIFCCAKGGNEPGQLARIINNLLFRSKYIQLPPEKEKDDWAINIHYFKGISCQNTHFSMNRIFGVMRKAEPVSTTVSPIRLFRILPIGGKDSIRKWWEYAERLTQHLTEAFEENYYLFWQNAAEKEFGPEVMPDWEQNDELLPSLIIIRRTERSDFELSQCPDCGEESYGAHCRRRNVWS